MNEGLLSLEQIKSVKILREIYRNSKTESLSEERRIWNEQIVAELAKCELSEDWIIMTDEVFDYIIELTEKLKDTIK